MTGLNYDDIEMGLVARTENLTDGEKMLTTMMTKLDELDYLITNALGYMPNNVPEHIKAKNKKGEKVDVMSGTQVTDNTSLGNKTIPRHAAKPNAPTTVKKPAVKKSRDYTGSSLSKLEPKPTPEDWEDESDSEPDYDPETGEEVESEDEPDYDPTDDGDYYKGPDMDKLLPLVAVGAKAVDTETKMSPEQHTELVKIKEAISQVRTLGKTLTDFAALREKDMRTQKTPANKVMKPQDQRSGTPAKSNFRPEDGRPL